MTLFKFISSLIIIFFGCGMTWCYFYEKALWNKGKCLKCGSDWIHFDNDSQGGRGYNCQCGQYIWISYPGIDKKKER